MKLKIKNKAYTLVELLLVVGLISIISAAVYIGYKTVKENQKVQEGAQLIKLILERVDEASAAGADYSNFANPIATTGATLITSAQTIAPPANVINSKLVPPNYVNGAFVTNPLNPGYLGFLNMTTAANTTTIAGKNFFLTVFVPNPGQCIKLATMLAPSYSALSMNVVLASGTTQWYGDSLVRPNGSAFNRTNIENYCLLGVNGAHLNFGISKPN